MRNLKDMLSRIKTRHLLYFFLFSLFSTNLNATQVSTTSTQVQSNTFDPNDWQQTLTAAKGQSVYFFAWGGSNQINQYLRWVSRQVKEKYQINLVHVKVADISEATTKLLAEKSANQDQNGSIDLLWVNGENFKFLKQQQLLFGPFADKLPNTAKIDTSLPVQTDFTEPTNGLESPWGLAQFVFIYDTKTISSPPQSALELLEYAKMHPNRITYPKPPAFHGSAFLKTLLFDLTKDPSALTKPVAKNFENVTQPLWAYLDELHQFAWQQGHKFPSSQIELLQLFDDNQIDLAFSFNPNEVYAAQSQGKLSKTTKAYAFRQGALTNVHFVAIPWNASHKAAAQVVANYLISPKAQNKKAQTKVWGDPSILLPKYLASQPSHPLFKIKSEIDPSWQDAIEKAWLKRYSK